LEPRFDDAQPFFRTLELGGYLGQGGMRMVLAPGAGDVERLSAAADVPHRGLFREHVGLDGRVGIVTATGFHVVRRPRIAVPRRRRRPDDTAGDRAANYKASGLVGDGPAHKVTGVTATSKGADPGDQRLAAMPDLHARIFNWDAVHPLAYHGLDWHLPQDDELSAPIAAPDFAALAGKRSLPAAATEAVDVDHRYGAVDVALSESSIDVPEDGSITVRCGWGAEIRMSRGHCEITTPGDVTFQAGRDVQIWAGRDFIVRAKGTVDISSTEGDARLKAGNNVQVLADKGALLLESKAASASYGYRDKVGSDVEAGGIHLKAATSAVGVYAADVLVRSGGSGDDGLAGRVNHPRRRRWRGQRPGSGPRGCAAGWPTA